QAKKNRTESYFSDFINKDMIGMLGYHYGFAGFNADVDYLNKNFKITLTDSHQSNIQMVLNGRGDIAVVSKAYLQYYFLHHPQDKSQLLVSQKNDQIYRHTVLLRKGKPHINIKDINRLLYRLKTKGVLQKLWTKHGIEKRL
ncbi:MAG: polar amino acid transport system substrate-binding protein, partial [Phenylobacterium sp.]